MNTGEDSQYPTPTALFFYEYLDNSIPKRIATGFNWK